MVRLFVLPGAYVVKCGEAKNNCFSIFFEKVERQVFTPLLPLLVSLPLLSTLHSCIRKQRMLCQRFALVPLMLVSLVLMRYLVLV